MAAPQQQGQGNDSGLGFLWIIMGIFIIGFLIWHFGQTYIVSTVFKIKLFEIWFISFFTHTLEPVKAWVYLNTNNTHNVTFPQLILLSTAVGGYLAYPFAIMSAILATVLYTSSVAIRFRNTMNMKKLSENEKENWPQISPVLKMNLINASIDEGPWAMSTPPMVFAKKYNLLREEMAPLTEESLSKESKVIAIMKRQAATRVFALQLGQIWEGPEKLPVYAQALLAIFCARANHETEAAAKLLRQISASASQSTLDFSGTQGLLKKYYDTKAVQFVVQRHAYVLTVMASMLEIARTDGVLASADFLWLKPIDRKLWYMLNTVGRQTAVPEVAGAFAHWITEKEIGRRLTVPMVEQATNALEAALQEIIYKPDEKPHQPQKVAGKSGVKTNRTA
jgi:intracellular multiplication protein IcmP